MQISDAFLAGADSGADSGAGSGAAAAPAWARLPADRQDALSAALARLGLRIGAIRPLAEARTGAHRTAVAERLLAGACTVDYMFRAMNALFTGTNSTADLSVRDLYMAQTLAWHLEQAGPGARFVLAAHNNHVQKTPAVFDGTMAALPMGQHLARMLGGTYVAIGLTHTDDHVPEMRPDAAAPVGFTLETTHLPAPRPGTIEAALAGAGLTAAPTLTNLRQAPTHSDGRPLLDGIRTQSAVMDTSLGHAFAAVISTPTATHEPWRSDAASPPAGLPRTPHGPGAPSEERPGAGGRFRWAAARSAAGRRSLRRCSPGHASSRAGRRHPRGWA